MSQKFPADRTLVDTQRKIIDPWLGPLKRLEPLLPLLTAENIATLRALIQAAQEAVTEDGTTADPFALPITNEPLFSEDWAVIYKNSENAGRRTPLTFFQGVPVLISTTIMTGSASALVTVPSGYTDVELRVIAASQSGAGSTSIAFSEDSGSTFLTQSQHIFNDADKQAGSATSTGLLVNPPVASDVFYDRTKIFEYASATTKSTFSWGLNVGTNEGYVGPRVITSTAAINSVRYSVSAGTWDAGTIELWGIP